MVPCPAGSTCQEGHCKKTTQGGDIIMCLYHNSERGALLYDVFNSYVQRLVIKNFKKFYKNKKT